MEEESEDLATRLYAEFWKKVNAKKQEQEPTLLKSLFNITCVILVLGTIMIVGIIIDFLFKISKNEDLSDIKKKIEVSLYN